MQPRSIAIIGTGMIGAVHWQAARQAGARLRGVLASSPERSRQIASEWGAECAYTSIEAVMADPLVEVVHICSPNAFHFPAAEAALKAGKHVICEKPLATTQADAQALAALATERGLVATVPFVYRYHPMVREARARVRSGDIGALQLIHGSYLQDWLLDSRDSNWRVDPGKGGASRAFADIGSHWCDLVEWISGERFESVVASLSTTIKSRPALASQTFSAAAASPAGPTVAVNTEDVAVALLRTTTGTLANVTISQVSAGRKNRLWFEIDGAKHSLVFDQETPEQLWIGGVDSVELRVKDPSRGACEQRRLATVPAGHGQGYVDCFAAFIGDTYRAIDGESPEGLPTFMDGLRSAAIVDAVLNSVAQQGWVAIAADPRTLREPTQ
ncbi:Gfo/Idh/MocA family protein [Pseudomonas gingeri]|uniref:Gfo/Idh/MocA family oxidoreductase n=1 Tax=Pseudomonas gingeri TaxID=117681 RepID=A0A7Y7YDC7_9PSED|nr:Gfo/Idh/MocA family oxidoreductase [Pseudomonas gingeri]NWA01553.1 Gfo/Idh/MocA family oxidoreductase [Pseudomonas gingeri]NWA13644.1 Gfo/Idh/MocA family oxidoreductase [Pseudomonas gingeri]NWA52996.1 Gfo/Idh/MocA family oxidoreductase [Pseudomonas gingeri]NWA96493.1 Gfo/Idh/MocA family oxidoreductase [Pseudomonas gingeri]NWA99870.1 Gfo/Idh/MocA family oxidoreductase [Pseudomonas gingeri]